MFDFRALYQNYSTEELLRIVQQPALYQNTAVEVAQKILTERQVTIEEFSEVQATIAHEQEVANRPGKTQQAAERLGQFIAYLFTPSEQFDPQKWIYWLCVALSMHYVTHVYNTFSYVRYVFFRCDDCSMDAFLTITLITWVYLPFTIAGLLQRKKNGWILAVFYVTLQVIGLTISFLSGWTYLKHLWLSQSIWIAAYVGASVLLRKPDIRNIFKVSISLWKQVFFLALGVATVISIIGIITG